MKTKLLLEHWTKTRHKGCPARHWQGEHWHALTQTLKDCATLTLVVKLLPS